MTSILPIAIGSLIRDRSIESVRVEFKASWSADVTGFQVLKTLCMPLIFLTAWAIHGRVIDAALTSVHS